MIRASIHILWFNRGYSSIGFRKEVLVSILRPLMLRESCSFYFTSMILIDFNDRLKSITHGYGSMDYEMSEYQEAKLCRLDIRVNNDPADAFSSIVHVDKAESRGRLL